MVAGDKESDGDGDEGGGRATATRAKVTGMRAMVTVTGVTCNKEARARVMPKEMRVVRNEEGKGSKATATATRVAGERWQWQQGWWARKRARLARMAMAMKRRRRDDDETTTRRDDDKTTTRQRDDDKTTTRRCSGYHGRLIFLANGAQRVTHISYVGRYVGLVQSRIKNMSLRTNGVNLVLESTPTAKHF
jgi:hypothetical protein